MHETEDHRLLDERGERLSPDPMDLWQSLGVASTYDRLREALRQGLAIQHDEPERRRARPC